MLEDKITKIVENIKKIIEDKYPEILVGISNKLFQSQGAFNGRPAWADNTIATIKKKGINSPNIQTGLLKSMLTNKDFMSSPSWYKNVTSINHGYDNANKMRNFSSIGSDIDDDFIIDELIKCIEHELK